MTWSSDVELIRKLNVVELLLTELFNRLGKVREVGMIVVDSLNISPHSLLRLHPFEVFLPLTEPPPASISPDQSFHVKLGKFTVVEESPNGIDTSPK